MTDKRLLALLRSDPQKGLSAAVEKYSAYVMKIVRIKLGEVCPEEDIEEAVSDIFLGFYQTGGRCGFEISSVKSYIAVIARRHCAGVFAKRTAQAETISFDEIEATVAADEHGDDEHERIKNALGKLGQPDEEIFVRKYFLGQKTKDIAHDLGMKENTVDKRVSRGLVRLRKLLEEES